MTLPLEKRIEISHDTRLFRFSLPSKEHVLGLPVGQHLFIACVVDGKKVLRAYTPLTSGAGYVDFVIKVYFANVHPRFPDGGKLTQHLDKLALGDTIQVKGCAPPPTPLCWRDNRVARELCRTQLAPTRACVTAVGLLRARAVCLMSACTAMTCDDLR